MTSDNKSAAVTLRSPRASERVSHFVAPIALTRAHIAGIRRYLKHRESRTAERAQIRRVITAMTLQRSWVTLVPPARRSD